MKSEKKEKKKKSVLSLNSVIIFVVDNHHYYRNGKIKLHRTLGCWYLGWLGQKIKLHSANEWTFTKMKNNTKKIGENFEKLESLEYFTKNVIYKKFNVNYGR